MTQSVNTNYLKKKQGSTIRFTKKTKLLSFYQQTRYTCLRSSSPKNKGINCNIKWTPMFLLWVSIAKKSPRNISSDTVVFTFLSACLHVYVYISLGGLVGCYSSLKNNMAKWLKENCTWVSSQQEWSSFYLCAKITHESTKVYMLFFSFRVCFSLCPNNFPFFLRLLLSLRTFLPGNWQGRASCWNVVRFKKPFYFSKTTKPASQPTTTTATTISPPPTIFLLIFSHKEFCGMVVSLVTLQSRLFLLVRSTLTLLLTFWATFALEHKTIFCLRIKVAANLCLVAHFSFCCLMMMLCLFMCTYYARNDLD